MSENDDDPARRLEIWDDFKEFPFDCTVDSLTIDNQGSVFTVYEGANIFISNEAYREAIENEEENPSLKLWIGNVVGIRGRSRVGGFLIKVRWYFSFGDATKRLLIGKKGKAAKTMRELIKNGGTYELLLSDECDVITPAMAIDKAKVSVWNTEAPEWHDPEAWFIRNSVITAPNHAFKVAVRPHPLFQTLGIL
ncbi:hypothetical protein V5O48_013491 [Marasmius crinis-equi]|uniref:K Homology domain-containing protein n=1 Tax=Marasmius crinis-equi TaxID=585013 RepID=A0ABR3EZY5_9AGAR